MKLLKKALNNPKKAVREVLIRTLKFISPLLGDEAYIKLMFLVRIGHFPDLKNPKTFNEKLQWLKIHNRKDIFTIFVDKVKVKDYIAEVLGKEYLIPTLGVWDKPEDVDFDALPEKFVIKCNHNSGLGMTICTDKANLDLKKVREKLRQGLREDYYLYGREWPYKNVERKIIAEQFMEESDEDTPFNVGGLTDYKFTCFNGNVTNVMVCIGRATGHTKFYFYDREWNLLPLNKLGRDTDPNFKVPKPEKIAEMFEIAEKLSKGIPYLRVDLYYVQGKIYFGEMTFFPDSGWDPNLLAQTDIDFGNKIDLSLV